METAEPHIFPVCPGIHIYRTDGHTLWKIAREARPQETSPKHKDVASLSQTYTHVGHGG